MTHIHLVHYFVISK